MPIAKSVEINDWLWGEKSESSQIIARVLIKLVLATLAAAAVTAIFYCVWIGLSPGARAWDIQQKIKAALASIPVTSDDSKDDPFKHISFAVLGSHRYGISYQIRFQPSAKSSGTVLAARCIEGKLYTVDWSLGVPKPMLKDSVDVMMRRLEHVAFNAVDPPCPKQTKNPAADDSSAVMASEEYEKADVEAVKSVTSNTATKSIAAVLLCSGTEESLDDDKCARTRNLRDRLVMPEYSQSLEPALSRVHSAALFVGPIQFVTLVFFFLALLDTYGLWARWVSPPDLLADYLQMDSADKKAQASFNEAVRNARAQKSLSIVDRFIVNVTSASGNVKEMPDFERLNSLRQILRNYRDHLQADADAKQDSLEMLGDTILKVAFFGTVLGIGAALFEARLLDASDPLRQLESKAILYSGIGVGFGATTVGIVLSIFAAFARTALREQWAQRIETGYRIASDFYERTLDKFVKELVDIPGPLPVPRTDPFRGLRVFLAVISLVFIGWVLLKYLW